MTAPTAADLAQVPLLAVLTQDELQSAAQRFMVRLYSKGAILVGRVLRVLTRGGHLRMERGRIEIVRKLPRRW